MKGAALILLAGETPERWAAAARSADPERTILTWPTTGDTAAVRYAIAWNPPQGALKSLPNLAVIFSMGAGVDHLVLRDDTPDVPIVRVVSADLAQRMTEWVTLQVLMHHRQQRAYDAHQRAARWHELQQPAAPTVRVGIMGMGVLGHSAAASLVHLGFDVAGWSRQPRDVPGVQSFHGGEQLDAFLARTDILVSLLPLTRDTRGILAMPLFRKLARDGALGAPVMINAGRGGLQIEADIVAALDAGVLRGVSLDVFEKEPLAPDSPLWRNERVIITPHAAAWSSPEALAPPMVRAMTAFEAGTPLENVVDRTAGY